MSIEGGTWIGATRTESARITSGSKHLAGPETNELQYDLHNLHAHTNASSQHQDLNAHSSVQLCGVTPRFTTEKNENYLLNLKAIWAVINFY